MKFLIFLLFLSSTGRAQTSNPFIWRGDATEGNISYGLSAGTKTSVLLLPESGTMTSSDVIRLKSPALASSYNLVLPNAVGSNYNIIKTDGSGNASWTSIDSPSFFTTGALATTGGSAGIVNPYTESSGVVYAAEYTPTLPSDDNVTSASVIGARYTRVGPIVTVYGSIDVDPTSAATITKVAVTLPIASNLATTADLDGVASQRQVGAVYVAGKVQADTTNDRADIYWVSGSDVSLREINFTFSYIIK